MPQTCERTAHAVSCIDCIDWMNTCAAQDGCFAIDATMLGNREGSGETRGEQTRVPFLHVSE